MRNLIKKNLNFGLSGLADFSRKKPYRLMRKLRLTIGAILIELAFALPIFLVLIYYIHDLPKQKLMHRKMQFVAYELTSIVQNIAQQKSATSSPLLTKRDLGRSAALAGLSVFPGDTFWLAGRAVSKTGYMLHTIWHYVEAAGDNKGRQRWSLSVYPGNTCGASGDIDTNQSHDTTIILWSTSEMVASSIYPGLTLDNFDKMLVEVEFFYDYLGRWGWKFPSRISTGKVSPRDAFGFLLMGPKGHGQNNSAFFPAVTVFVPIAGGFSKTKVPQ